MRTIFTPDQDELRRISELPTEPALRRAAAFLADLVRDRTFLHSLILPLIQGAEGEKDWYVARRYEAEDAAYSLKVFVWPSGTGTRIHDHSSWGAYCCASGAVLEERYESLDDGSRPGHARLKKIWQLWWTSSTKSRRDPRADRS